MINPFKFLLLIILLQFTTCSFSQNIWLNTETNLLNEQTVNPDSNFHYTVKPYTVNDFNHFNKIKDVKFTSRLEVKLLNDNMMKIEGGSVKVKVNPIIHTQYFYDNKSKDLFYNNRIGINIFAKFKDKFYITSDIFYSKSKLSESQSLFADSFKIIPHYGRYLSSNNIYDFMSFTGELTYKPNNNIFFHLGRGKHFFGNGYHSLFLSDNSNSYTYFKTTVDIWKIKYVWLVANLNDFELYKFEQDFTMYNKAAFMHYFSYNVSKRININFFETIITNPYDHKGNRVGYEAAYYNPVVFFRPVEFYSGTSDNSLLGLGLNIRLFKSLHLYSQFILDDLIISRLNDGSGWWGNKFGIQAGLKSYNFLNVKGLFLRGEINVVRPYTYSHGINVSDDGVANLNYGSYHQNLAHPLGANFAEGIAEINYNKGRFMTSATIILAKKGVDKDTVSYGGDIYKDYNLRPNDLGITFLQGEIYNYTFANIKASYLINPNYNLRFELGAYYRNVANLSNTTFYFGLSTNIFNDRNDFMQ